MNDEAVTVVLNGFFNLNGKEKLAVVEAINDYFDSNDRDPIRAAHDAEFAKLDLDTIGCKCCGRGGDSE